MLKHFVEFWYPGMIFSDSSSREIESRDIESIEVPDNAYAFSLFDKEMIVQAGETLWGEPKNKSTTYYCGGVRKNYQTICKEMGSDSICARNMLCNDTDFVVETRFKQYMSLKTDDVILSTWTTVQR